MVISDDEAAGPMDATAGGAPTGGPRPSRRRALVVVAVVVVAVLLPVGWFVLSTTDVQPSTEEQARQRLEAGTVVPSGSTSIPASVTSPLSAAPAQGVYRYRGSGTEDTSFPPLTEEQGPAMPATVTATADGCWVLRIDYNTHHWQDWTLCTADGRLVDRGGATYSRRSIGAVDLENTSTFTCDPAPVIVDAADPPGTAHERSCVGAGSLLPDPTTVAGTTTNVGRETVEVDGRSVPTIHVRDDLTYTGAQSGTETTDTWFELTTGLPVRNEHHIVAITSTPVGDITYTEDASYSIESLDPV